MALRTLTAPVTMPNITKAEIVDVTDKSDAAVPFFSIQVRFRGAGGRDAGTHTLTARDTANSNVIVLNATPAGFGDVIQSGGVTQVDGACASLATAWDTAYAAATGTRAAKRRAGNEAALTKAQEIGLVGAGLASA